MGQAALASQDHFSQSSSQTDGPEVGSTSVPDSQRRRHRVQLPPPTTDDFDQDQAYLYVVEQGRRERIRFHEYAEIYSRPGLYEQIFYDRLKCDSPRKVAEILNKAVRQNGEESSTLRVLDLGAGNGLSGEALKDYGVCRLVGLDILEAARGAAIRDRPGLYDHYYVADICNEDSDLEEELASWSFDCLLSVAALGFGDIPPAAFLKALSLTASEGWVAFNIKETFLDSGDVSGFSVLIRELIFSDYLDLFHLERYRHRLSIDGKPLHYFAVTARKTGAPLPPPTMDL